MRWLGQLGIVRSGWRCDVPAFSFATPMLALPRGRCFCTGGEPGDGYSRGAASGTGSAAGQRDLVPGGGGDPLWADFSGQRAFNIQAFYDTGASGILLSANTAASLGNFGNPGISQQTYNSQPVVYEDVGVAGSDRFNVSTQLNVAIAPFHPNIDQNVADAEDQFNSTHTFQGLDLSYYNHTFTNVRTQIGQVSTDPANQDPLLDDLDVFGIPTMKGKVVVMNPSPSIRSSTRSHVHYAPGTAYNAAPIGFESGNSQDHADDQAVVRVVRQVQPDGDGGCDREADADSTGAGGELRADPGSQSFHRAQPLEPGGRHDAAGEDQLRWTHDDRIVPSGYRGGGVDHLRGQGVGFGRNR